MKITRIVLKPPYVVDTLTEVEIRDIRPEEDSACAMDAIGVSYHEDDGERVVQVIVPWSNIAWVDHDPYPTFG